MDDESMHTMSVASEFSDDTFKATKESMNELEDEETSLLQIRKQLLTVQQFRIDQERKNNVIKTLKQRIDVLEQQKTTMYVDCETLRKNLLNKEAVEASYTQVVQKLDESNDKLSIAQLEINSLKQEVKSQLSKYVVLFCHCSLNYFCVFLDITT